MSDRAAAALEGTSSATRAEIVLTGKGWPTGKRSRELKARHTDDKDTILRPLASCGGYVAASRVQVRRHYLSDVVLGATLGVVAGRSVTIGRGDTKFALGPSVVPGGAGVNFTLVGRH
jgi:hypothetical protein